MRKTTKKLENQPVSQTPPNPVELMVTWCDLFTNLIITSWICGAISMSNHGDDPIAVVIISTGILVALAGLPGVLIYAILDSVREKFGEVLPMYYRSKSLFSNGIRSAWQRCSQHFSISMLLTAYLGLTVLIGDLIGLFNPDAFILSLVGIMFMSLFGGFAILGRIVIDVFRGMHRARQVL